METTRHFVATVYVVRDGATLLHEHEKLGLWLPPGGHIDRDELPHEAAVREVREETGLGVELLADRTGPASETVSPLPEPEQLLVEDIDVRDGEVLHQHIDFVFYAVTSTEAIDPAPGEAPASAWEWITRSDFRTEESRYEPDVIEMGIDAIDTAERKSEE